MKPSERIEQFFAEELERLRLSRPWGDCFLFSDLTPVPENTVTVIRQRAIVRFLDEQHELATANARAARTG
jgi:hypothetical protein